MSESLSQQEFTRMIVTLWAIWSSRRKTIHEDLFKSPWSTHGFVNSCLNDIQFLQRSTETRQGTAMVKPNHWIPPPTSYVKINVDVAVSRSGEYGAVGAIYWDQDGMFIGASITMFSPRIVYPSTLEALATREAMALAEDTYSQRTFVASDCKTVVDAIRSGSASPYGAVINEIREHMSGFNSCIISHGLEPRMLRLRISISMVLL